MDISKAFLTEQVSSPDLLKAKQDSRCVPEEKQEQIAKDFESIFIQKLLDKMKDTVIDWSEEKDGPAKQIDGIFWTHLAREVADQGGLGMWKDIYQFFKDTQTFDSSNENGDHLSELL